MIPVVFLQVWKKCNVDIAVRTAQRTNVVHLICDRDYTNGSCVFHDIKRYRKAVADWLDFQRQGSLNDFESLCMYRWVCIRRLMDDIGADIVWACDSDVLVYVNAIDEHERLGRPEMTFSYCPESKKSGANRPLGHAGHSFVSRKHLDEFIAKRHPEWNDMFAWTTLIYDTKIPVLDTSEIRNGTVLDHHMGNDLESYDSFHDMKRVRFKHGIPSVRHKNHGDIKTSVLHCWSPAEVKMDTLSRLIDLV